MNSQAKRKRNIQRPVITCLVTWYGLRRYRPSHGRRHDEIMAAELVPQGERGVVRRREGERHLGNRATHYANAGLSWDGRPIGTPPPHVGNDAALRVPKNVVATEGLHAKPEESISSNPLRLFIIVIALGSVGALGGLLIDWPSPWVGFPTPAVWILFTAFLLPLGVFVIIWMMKRKRPSEFTILLLGLFYGGVLWLHVILDVVWQKDFPLPFLEFSNQAVLINLTAFLFPLGYIVITWTAKKKGPSEFTILLVGLFYGGVLWLQVILEVFFRTTLKEQDKWDYLQGHAYDLFAVAAIIGAVSFFSADRRRIVRIGSLATAFAVTGTFTGFTEAEYLWGKGGFNSIPNYPYWALLLLWALTGIWYGLCVGFLAPEDVLAGVLRGEPGS